MPQLTVDNISGFHLEPTNICTLKCPGCARTRFIDNWPQHWANHSIDIDQLFKFLDVDLSGKKFMLCGNYGDPIYHPEFHDLVRRIKQAGASVCIDTNGSYRTQQWWQDLAEIVDDNDIIRFGIDGLPENFTNYRVNADWQSIKVGIEIMTQSECKIVWKFIPFSYNQHDIQEAKKLSIELGMDEFYVSFSDRFDSETDHLKPTDALLGARYAQQIHFKKHIEPSLIDPICSNQREHYISAEGVYMPCCYIGDHRFYYKTQFGKHKKNYNIHDQTLSQILNQPAIIEFYQNLNRHSVCQFNCPKNHEKQDNPN